MVTWAGGGGGYCLRALCFPLSAPVADRTGQNEEPSQITSLPEARPARIQLAVSGDKKGNSVSYWL